MSTTLLLNGKSTTLDADPTMPLLWAVRELAGLHGTQFGGGEPGVAPIGPAVGDAGARQ